ncbi:MAG: sugar phosphate isomerase/epimerase [Pedobacter sp.]|nr:sugar phosphate isomerase/epimerase [Pedobacter sp.]
MITRRNFVISTSIAATAAWLLPSFACNAEAKKVGLQLYSLRDRIGSDVKLVLEQVAKAGYGLVETYGFSIKDKFWGLSPNDLKKILDDNNLSATSGHYGLGSYLVDGNTDELIAAIEAAGILKSEYLTVPYLDASLRTSIDDYKKIADKLNKAAEMCKKTGLKLSYHNHNFEFIAMGDTNGYETLLKETDKNLVDFEMDLYWVARAGKIPVQLFKEHPGRFKMWHIKDMDKKNPNLNTEVGSGRIDFKPIFAQAKLAGMEHFFVEQENNYYPNELDSIRTSCDYIEKVLI